MSLNYQCDRCGEHQELHVRELVVTYLGPGATLSDPEESTYHLCSWCWVEVRTVMYGEGST